MARRALFEHLERWQSGRMYLTRNQAYRKVPWVRIPPSPPSKRHRARARDGRECRHLSSAAFTTWVSFRKEAFCLAGGSSVSTFHVSANVTRHFCKVCSSHIYTDDARHAVLVGVPAGAMAENFTIEMRLLSPGLWRSPGRATTLPLELGCVSGACKPCCRHVPAGAIGSRVSLSWWRRARPAEAGRPPRGSRKVMEPHFLESARRPIRRAPARAERNLGRLGACF